MRYRWSLLDVHRRERLFLGGVGREAVGEEVWGSVW